MVGKIIFIVDDEVLICEMIVVVLEMVGYECLEVENIQQVYVVIVDCKLDLILFDWMFFGIFGIELV